MSPARPAAVPIPNSTRARTVCTSLPATPAVPVVPSQRSRPVSVAKSAAERGSRAKGGDFSVVEMVVYTIGVFLFLFFSSDVKEVM